MKFSMNGFRRQLSGDVETLRDIAADIVRGDFYDKDDFINVVNEVITKSNVLNCLYQEDDPEFQDMGHVEVEHLDFELEVTHD